MKSSLEENVIEMYSKYNKGKFVIAERFKDQNPKKIKFINTCLQYQKMFILIN